MLPPTGERYLISGGGYEAVIGESGATLCALRHHGVDLIDGVPEDAVPSGGRGQLLMPWPNRVGDGRYTFAGQTLQLPVTEVGRGNANHGLVRWVSWRPVAQESDRLVMGCRLMAQSGYPWTLDLEVTYRVGEDGLTVTQQATNRAGTAAPYASGAHPYLSLGAGPVDDWTLCVPAASTQLTDDRMLPTGRRDVAGTDLDFRSPRPIGDLALDTCFGELSRGDDGLARVRVSTADRAVELWLDGRHHWIMVFTGEGSATARRSLAVEPMTAPANAFDSGTDLVRLDPGETMSADWGIRVPE